MLPNCFPSFPTMRLSASHRHLKGQDTNFEQHSSYQILHIKHRLVSSSYHRCLVSLYFYVQCSKLFFPNLNVSLKSFFGSDLFGPKIPLNIPSTFEEFFQQFLKGNCGSPVSKHLVLHVSWKDSKATQFLQLLF
jgi:hypothetical protein